MVLDGDAQIMALPQSFEPISNAVHLCIDMQNVFAPGGIWETPWMERVLPVIVGLAELNPPRTVFTRFITPLRAEDRPGRWQRYFAKWECATRSQLSPSQLEIVPPLSRLIPPATVINKPAYSAFAESVLTAFLREKNIDTLIITGSETDVCVLATVLDAVDLGFRVIVVEDALCSSFDEGHDALMTLYRNRFSEQIELMTHAHVSELWRDRI
jgi:nicotinamidase-related amidase